MANWVFNINLTLICRGDGISYWFASASGNLSTSKIYKIEFLDKIALSSVIKLDSHKAPLSVY